MKQRIIFLDIDGTLTEPGKNEPPASAVKAIIQAREAGHYIFLCTGRSYGMLRPLLQYPFDGIIASSGGYIEYQKEVLFDCPMTESQRQSAMDVLKKNRVFRTVECLDGSYADEGLGDFLRTHAKKGNSSELLRWREQIEKSLNIRPMKEYKGQPLYKIVIMSPSQEQLLEPRKVLDADFTFCIHDADEDGFIDGEIVNKAFNKGKALLRVCNHLQIPVQDSIAFGDSLNDREMIEMAGLGVCMENGSRELKKLADDICPPVTEDGIFHAFRKYQLIGE